MWVCLEVACPIFFPPPSLQFSIQNSFLVSAVNPGKWSKDSGNWSQREEDPALMANGPASYPALYHVNWPGPVQTAWEPRAAFVKTLLHPSALSTYLVLRRWKMLGWNPDQDRGLRHCGGKGYFSQVILLPSLSSCQGFSDAGIFWVKAL